MTSQHCQCNPIFVTQFMTKSSQTTQFSQNFHNVNSKLYHCRHSVIVTVNNHSVNNNFVANANNSHICYTVTAQSSRNMTSQTSSRTAITTSHIVTMIPHRHHVSHIDDCKVTVIGALVTV